MSYEEIAHKWLCEHAHSTDLPESKAGALAVLIAAVRAEALEDAEKACDAAATARGNDSQQSENYRRGARACAWAIRALKEPE